MFQDSVGSALSTPRARVRAGATPCSSSSTLPRRRRHRPSGARAAPFGGVPWPAPRPRADFYTFYTLQRARVDLYARDGVRLALKFAAETVPLERDATSHHPRRTGLPPKATGPVFSLNVPPPGSKACTYSRSSSSKPASDQIGCPAPSRHNRHLTRARAREGRPGVSPPAPSVADVPPPGRRVTPPAGCGAEVREVSTDLA